MLIQQNSRILQGGGIIIKKFNWKCNNSNLTECDIDNELRHLKVNFT